MNKYVRYYIEARRIEANQFNRQLIFTSIAQTIANHGTIEDLQALTKYYQGEWEVILNDRTTSAVSVG